MALDGRLDQSNILEDTGATRRSISSASQSSTRLDIGDGGCLAVLSTGADLGRDLGRVRGLMNQSGFGAVAKTLNFVKRLSAT